jgi:tripartite-type tricarboxylate transporter receptor subunit TctC
MVRSALVACLAVLGVAVGLTSARAEPPISLVVGYAPGGTTDTIARVIGAKLQEKLGRTVIVENKPGATGQLGSRLVAKSAPDGNTLQIVTQTTHAVAPNLYAKIGYDPIKDFTPINLVAWSPLALVANPKMPVSNVKDLIQYLKDRPGAVNYATGGIGDGSHMAALFFAKLAGVNPVAIPFQGEGPALPQVLGNQIPYMFISTPTAAALIASGELKGLAVTSKVRAPNLPDLPTIQEAGLPGYEMVNWWGIIGPHDMPPELVKKLNLAIGETLKDPDARDKLSKLGFVLTGSTPEEFATYLQKENEKWAEVIKSQGLKAD